jgi:hypothetical protein
VNYNFYHRVNPFCSNVGLGQTHITRRVLRWSGTSFAISAEKREIESRGGKSANGNGSVNSSDAQQTQPNHGASGSPTVFLDVHRPYRLFLRTRTAGTAEGSNRGHDNNNGIVALKLRRFIAQYSHRCATRR